MHAIVMISVVMVLQMEHTAEGQDACTTAQLALAGNSVCLQELQSLADATSIGDFVNSSVCKEPCYSLVYNVANNCEEYVSYIAQYIASYS